MAKQISSLWVGLTGNVSGLAKSFNQAISPIKALGKAVSGVNGILATVGVGLGTAAIVNEFKQLIGTSLESIDVVAKLSDRMGITTEAITGLQHAGNLAGISTEELTGGLEKMLKTLGESAQTGKGATDTLARMGLNAKALAAIAPDEAFRQIADGLSAIHNPAERAAAAVDIFGKSGQSLLPLMLSGAEGIRAAQEEAKKLGLTFSRVDAAKVEAANDAWTRVQATLTGLGNTLAIQLAPTIERLSKSFTDWATEGEGVAGKIAAGLNSIESAAAGAADSVENLGRAFLGLPPAIHDRRGEALGKSLRGASQQFGADTIAFGDKFAAGMPAKRGFPEIHVPDFVGPGPLDKLMAAAGKAADALGEKFADAAAKNWERVTADAARVFDATRTPAEALAIELKNLSGLLSFGAINLDTFNRAATMAREDFEKTTRLEMKPLRAIASGSAESQAARFNAPTVAKNKGMEAARNEIAQKQLTVQEKIEANTRKAAEPGPTITVVQF